MKKSLVYFIFLLTTLSSYSQRWKSVRHEVSFGVGASNFLGDLGGSKGIGTHGIKDLKLRTTRPTIMVGYKYMLNPYFSVKGSLLWGLLSGDDSVTKNLVRNNRNLSFRSNLGEASAYIEYYPYAERVTPRYKIGGISGNRAFSLMPYIFAGVGISAFNPKANLEGEWLALQPLGTEGQGLAGRPDKYQRITLALPMGVGVKYRIDKQLAVSFELSLRYTMSDYIDDVSTSYYIREEIGEAYGASAAALSDRALDPSLGLSGVQEYNDGRNNYLQRGNPKYNDAYMFGIFSIHYRLLPGTTFIPKF